MPALQPKLPCRKWVYLARFSTFLQEIPLNADSFATGISKKFKREFSFELKAPLVLKISTLKTNIIDHTLITLRLQHEKYLMSRFKMMTRPTIVLPIRSVLTRMENIVVIPICADSESVYSDIVKSIFLYHNTKVYSNIEILSK